MTWLPFPRPCPVCGQRTEADWNPVLRGLVLTKVWYCHCVVCGTDVIASVFPDRSMPGA